MLLGECELVQRSVSSDITPSNHQDSTAASIGGGGFIFLKDNLTFIISVWRMTYGRDLK